MSCHMYLKIGKDRVCLCEHTYAQASVDAPGAKGWDVVNSSLPAPPLGVRPSSHT